jgi:hypothetical protein
LSGDFGRDCVSYGIHDRFANVVGISAVGLDDNGEALAGPKGEGRGVLAVAAQKDLTLTSS